MAMIPKADRSLTEAELQRLRRWQKRMLVSFLSTMSLIIVFVPLKLAIGLSQEVEYIVGTTFIVFALAGAVIQFSEKCPNCGARIGFQSRLILPPQCVKCKISFRKTD